jgi:G:T-mismatch repair DNA endonuclease (very short patch repair protein)
MTTNIPQTSRRRVIKGYSDAQIDWLNSIMTAENISIQHAESPLGEYKIPGIGKVDGYCHETNTVYEFHGDFWHGNPNRYKAENTNPISKKTYGELYQKTVIRDQRIRDAGYQLIVEWESDSPTEEAIAAFYTKDESKGSKKEQISETAHRKTVKISVHPHQLNYHVYQRKGYICDICDTRITTTAYRCGEITCDYDCCFKCYEKNESDSHSQIIELSNDKIALEDEIPKLLQEINYIIYKPGITSLIGVTKTRSKCPVEKIAVEASLIRNDIKSLVDDYLRKFTKEQLELINVISNTTWNYATNNELIESSMTLEKIAKMADESKKYKFTVECWSREYNNNPSHDCNCTLIMSKCNRSHYHTYFVNELQSDAIEKISSENSLVVTQKCLICNKVHTTQVYNNRKIWTINIWPKSLICNKIPMIPVYNNETIQKINTGSKFHHEEKIISVLNEINFNLLSSERTNSSNKYYVVEDLRVFAQRLGLSTTGKNKQQLVNNIWAVYHDMNVQL